MFDVNRRPWSGLDKASADEIVEVVSCCPSGAYQWRRPHAETANRVVEETPSLRLTSHGPSSVRGGIELKGGGAEPLTESTRVALCRCGQSGNNPSCDNSHRETGWKAT